MISGIVVSLCLAAGSSREVAIFEDLLPLIGSFMPLKWLHGSLGPLLMRSDVFLNSRGEDIIAQFNNGKDRLQFVRLLMTASEYSDPSHGLITKESVVSLVTHPRNHRRLLSSMLGIEKFCTLVARNRDSPFIDILPLLLWPK